MSLASRSGMPTVVPRLATSLTVVVRAAEAAAGGVLVPQLLHHLFAAIGQALEFAGLRAGKDVGGEQGQGDDGIGVADHGIGQLIGIDLAPAHGLARRRAAEPAGVGAGVGDLQEVVVAAFIDAQHFLDLGLGLEDGVLGRSAAQDPDGAIAGENNPDGPGSMFTLSLSKPSIPP